MAKDVGPTASTLETMTCRPSASDVNMIIITRNNVSIIYQSFVDLDTNIDYPPSVGKPSN
jgi:hypothetical protein